MRDPSTQADWNVRTNVTLHLQERGWGVDDLARESGIPSSQLRELLKVEESMDLKSVWLIARALGVGVTDLVIAGPPEPSIG